MKKTLILLTILLTIFSCSVNEKPEFLRVGNIKVLESNRDVLVISADAFFLNPNDIGGQLKTDELKVYINDNDLGTVSTQAFDVPAQKEFKIPLKASVPIDNIISNKNIEGLLGSLFSTKIKVQYKGELKYKAFGFTYTYEIDKTEKIKIKL